MGLDAKQIIRNVYSEPSGVGELAGDTVGTATSGEKPAKTEQYSWHQVIRKVYDSAAVKLKIVRVL